MMGVVGSVGSWVRGRAVDGYRSGVKRVGLGGHTLGLE